MDYEKNNTDETLEFQCAVCKERVIVAKGCEIPVCSGQKMNPTGYAYCSSHKKMFLINGKCNECERIIDMLPDLD